MSTYIKDLYVYDIFEIYSECGFVEMKTSFYIRNDTQKYRNECMQCRSSRHEEWYYNKNDKIKIYKKQCFQQNKNKINGSRKQFEKNRRESDLNFK